MKYISEERLRYLFTGDCGFDLDAMLKNECQELNQWQPIESAPKDRPILLYGSSIFKGRWSKVDNSWIEDGGLLRNPKQWTELPEEPK